MKRVLTCLAAIGWALAALSCAGPAGQSQPLTSTPPPVAGESWLIGKNIRYSPQAISGDNLVFHEVDIGEAGVEEQYITLYNMATRQEERLVTLSGDLFVDSPAIEGDRVVWASANRTGVDTYYGLDNGNWDVFLLDLETRDLVRITAEEHAQMGARISGDTIVWLDTRHREGDRPYAGPLDIYAYDLKSRTEKRLTANTTADGYSSPLIGISGDLVVWTDVRHADPSITNYPSNSPDYDNEICAYDLAAGLETRITTSPGNDYFPAVDGSRIVWLRRSSLNEADVFVYDVNTGEETQVSQSRYAAEGPGVFGDTVVWPDARVSEGNTSNDVILNGRGGASEIYMYDLKSRLETRLVEPEQKEFTLSPSGGQRFVSGDVWLSPVVHGDYLVFVKSIMVGPEVYAMRLEGR